MFRLKQRIARAITHTMLVLLMLAMGLMLSRSRAPTDLETVQARGYLNMVTRYGPSTYYVDAQGENGLEYLMAKAFADELGVELRVTVSESLGGLISRVNTTRADFAAANLNITKNRAAVVAFSKPYGEITASLLYRSGNRKPKSFDDVASDNFLIIADSIHSQMMSEAKLDFPHLSWREEANIEAQELMNKLNEGEIDYTVVDTHNYYMNRSIFPKVRAAFKIAEPLPMAWAFDKNSDGTLIKAANSFIDRWIESDTYNAIREAIYDRNERFSVATSQRFTRLVEQRLPEFQPMFEAAGEKYGIDWRMIAAIAYQESHWNPNAVSPTGVRGLMMLTRSTAEEMGVDDRLDPAQSLDGGVRYLLKSRDKLPDRIEEPDRTFFTLAAYNIGFGHLEDARILTERAGKNPDHWHDVKEHLPLLAKKQYYSTVKRGYARGWEPVTYVENIRHYFDILVIHSVIEARPPSEVLNATEVEEINLSIPAPL